MTTRPLTRVLALLATLDVDQADEICRAVLDEMADHDPYPTTDEYWADALWYIRFLAAGGGEAGFAAADAARTTDEETTP